MGNRGTRRRAAIVGVLALASLALAAAGYAGSKPAAKSGTAAGGTIKVGILHSLSGTMAISEVSVKDAELLAIGEINAKGGVLGKKLQPVIEDGASDWPTFAEKAQKLISVDKVASVFGGWTSASRKAMLPVFEKNKALLWYPVQYEGLEASPYIFYSGATTNQQIIPGLDYLKAKHHKLKAAKPQAVFNTLNGDSNVAFFKQLRSAGVTFMAPEGKVTIDGSNHHIYKTARIGVIQPNGLIKEVWNSGHPIKPDPFLKGYAWAKGLVG